MGWTDPRRLRRAHVKVAGLVLFGVFACGSSESGTQATAYDDVKCITTLPRHCCDLDARKGTPCFPDWDTAKLCLSWPAGAPISLYTTPCQGLVAIRLKTATYSSFYVYDAQTSALVAIGDNASDEDQTKIACGAGPAGFVVPAECGNAWLGTSRGDPCDPTTGLTPKKRDWCHDVYYPDGG